MQVAIQAIERMWRMGACERCKALAQARDEMGRNRSESEVSAVKGYTDKAQ
jgi:hypothetical protein